MVCWPRYSSGASSSATPIVLLSLTRGRAEYSAQNFPGNGVIGKFPRIVYAHPAIPLIARKTSHLRVDRNDSSTAADVRCSALPAEECSLTLSRVRRAGKPAEMFRTGGGVKLL